MVCDLRLVEFDPFVCLGLLSTSLLRRFLCYFLFLSLSRIKQCLPPSLDKNSTHYRDFLHHSQSCFCEPSWAARSIIVISISANPTQMIDGNGEPKIPSKFAKHAARYNEFGSNVGKDMFFHDLVLWEGVALRYQGRPAVPPGNRYWMRTWIVLVYLTLRARFRRRTFEG